MKIFFQTAESIPPPYANQIEIDSETNDKGELKVKFKQMYLQRDELDEDDILDEGFSLEDDLEWEGSLNEAWKLEFQKVAESVKTYNEVLNSAHDEVSIEVEAKQYSPKNIDSLKRFIEQLQQAIFEAEKREAPLNIIIKEVSNSDERNTELNASFLERTYSQTINGQKVPQQWNQLDEQLKLIFAGDYIYEKASNKLPTKQGLYVNLGNEWWFEVGKSLLIQPHKIRGFLI